MKTIVLILFTVFALNCYSQGIRVRDLTNQPTRSDSLTIVVDDDAFSSAKMIYAVDLAPRPSELGETTNDLNKTVTILPISLSGVDSSAKLGLINPDITNLPAQSTMTTVDELTFYDNTFSSRDEKITYGNFITDITTEATFESGINTIIGNEVTELYILNLTQTDTNFSFTYHTPTRDGSLTLVKIGDKVNGYITLDYLETNNAIYTTSNGLGGTFLPEVNTLVVNEDGLNVMFYTNGDIKLKDTRSGDYAAGYDSNQDINYSVSYITP